MIFVTVGTSSWDFKRLLKKMDELAKNMDEHVVMQIGYSEFKPKNAEFFRLTSKDEMDQYFKKAKIIVTHGGVGSIVNGLRNSKIIIVVPRMEKYNEISDDHQIILAKELALERKLLVVWNIDDLELIFKNIENESFNPTNTEYKLVNKLKNYIEDIK